MSTLVTIYNRSAVHPVRVTVQAVREAGRERLPNGEHLIPPEGSQDVLVDPSQTILLSEGEAQ